jgi:Xaa-Pro aminopeptidase
VLDPMEVNARAGRLRSALIAAEGDPEGLLVTSLTNIRYLTGFTGTAAMLFVLPGEMVLLTDGRYGLQATEQLAAAGVDARLVIAPTPDHLEQGQRIVSSAGVHRLGLEATHVSWARQQSFASGWSPEVELISTVGLVEQLRRVKDSGELSRLAEAARIADDALDRVRDRLAFEPTEEEFGRTLDFEMRLLGATGPSFETIVASGPNAAKPHHRPGPRRIRAGETVVLDFGALCDGYCSDMTRTVWVDQVADRDLRRMVDVVLASEAAGVAAVAPGVACAEVDRACRGVVIDAGWGDHFVHGTGHGVGLDIHEAPSVAATSIDTLEVGHVVTVEPGVYVAGLGGVRIEDTVVVTEDGCRALTRTPKDLP